MKENQFVNIPNEFRPVPLWSWNDLLTKDELRRQIKEFAAKGWGGFFMHPRVGILTKINSPEWFEMINFCVEEAEKEGIQAWLYDEDRWPSGYGGGEVTETEEFRQRALVLIRRDELGENDTLLAECDYGNDHYCIANRVSAIGDPWFNGMCYVDLMNPKAVQKFLSCTAERYKEHCGKDFGKRIPGIFTDEPNYKMHNNYKMPSLPWSEYLEDFFRSRHGYDITAHLPELFFPVGDYQKIRFDFFDSASNLLLESFTKQYYEWCDKNNLKLVGHFMAEDSLHYQTQWVGNVMPHYEFMHYPGIDKLGRHINRDITVKQVASVAEQLGKERTLSEVYGCIGQHCGFTERKWIADWQAVSGINFVDPHLALYSMRGVRKRDFPSNLNCQQPWWEDQMPFSDYISRLSQVAAFGKHETKILVLHTIGSAWSVFNPLDMVPGHSTEYDPPFGQLTEKLLAENLDFHYGDEIIMQRHASVKDGKLIIGNCEYTAVIVPPALTLRASTCRLLNEFSKASPDRLIYVRPLPERVDGAKTDFPFGECVKKNSVNDAVEYLNALFPDRVLTTDILSGKNAARIFCCTKNDGETKLALFVNTEKRREIKASLSVADSRTPYLLDLSSGQIREIPYRREGERVVVDATLYAAGSITLVFSDNAHDVLPPVYHTDTGAEFASVMPFAVPCTVTSVRVLDTNVLPINDASIYINDLKAENMPLPRLWRDYFYSQPDGSKFAAEYKFTVREIPEGQLFAAIECAQNLDRITLNGTPLTPLRKRGAAEVFDSEVNYLDVSFVKVPLTNVKTGENILRIEGVKTNNTNGAGGHTVIDNFNDYHCTELDAIYIIGNFLVEQRDLTEFRITKRTGSPDYKNLTADGYPFYAGKCEIRAKVSRPDCTRAYLRLSDVSCCDAVISVNGSKLCEKYMKPYICDITDYLTAGENEISVVIAGTLFNLMGPNRRDDILDIAYVGPETFDEMDRYTEKYTLIPFGIGGIELLYERS